MERLGTVVQSVRPSGLCASSTRPRTRSEARVLARMHPEHVLAVTDRFLNSFRNDPDLTPTQAAIQAEGITRIFAAYPEEVVHEVTDLVNGLPSRQRFFPHLHEVKAACDEAIAPLHRTVARDLAILETQALIEGPANGERTPDENARIDEAVARLKAEIAQAEDSKDAIRKKVAAEIADGTDWHIAGLMKARGLTSLSLDESLAIAREFKLEKGFKWDSTKGPISGRPRGVIPSDVPKRDRIAAHRDENAKQPAKPRETPEEALARLSGLSLEEATAKFNALPHKDNSETRPRTADLETSAGPSHDVSPPAGGDLD